MIYSESNISVLWQLKKTRQEQSENHKTKQGMIYSESNILGLWLLKKTRQEQSENHNTRQ